MLTHSVELGTPSRSDLDRSFLLQSIPCRVLASPCHCGSEDSNRKSPVDFTKRWSKPLAPVTQGATSRSSESQSFARQMGLSVQKPQGLPGSELPPQPSGCFPAAVVCKVGWAALPTALDVGSW